ncbi:hypothetical protein ACFPOE_22905 [Caenimonas terrae]|uniref:Uncharacterized protein n=1 Tax=Caenimonas terrae TaxID=696074 RepID=A0ABW0NK53_9BURK
MIHRFLAGLTRAAAVLAIGAASMHAMADDAAGLRAKHAELREQLASNPFKRPLVIESAQAGDNLKGDVYAVLDHPFSTLSGELKTPENWCDILILPFNTKYCHAVSGDGGTNLMVRIGRKFDQPVQDAYKLQFSYRGVAATPDYFESRLRSKEGPIGTRDYHIVISAVPLDDKRTFMHLSYSYGYGFAGRVAMQAYLATAGADKVGFSVTGRDANGQPVYMGGVRGAVERNAMRYYLAIDSYLDSLSAPEGQRAERRIQSWFNATERYPRQLREMDRPTYVAMKRNEVERQQALIQ